MEIAARAPVRGSQLRARTIVVAVAATVVAGACSSGGSEVADGDSATGAEVYARACASCHGADLRGTERGPSHLSKVYEPGHHSDASFRMAITVGVRAHHWDFGDMPPVEGLTDAEIDAVIAFVRQQQQRHGFESYPPP